MTGFYFGIASPYDGFPQSDLHEHKVYEDDGLVDGIENVQVDTIHGVLGYKRPGPDGKVVWAPPSALRRIDLILVDEASQYDNKEWKRFAQSVDGSFTIDWQREDDQPRLLRALRDEYAVFCHFRACDLYNVWDYVWPSGERYPVQYFGICPRSI